MSRTAAAPFVLVCLTQLHCNACLQATKLLKRIRLRPSTASILFQPAGTLLLWADATCTALGTLGFSVADVVTLLTTEPRILEAQPAELLQAWEELTRLLVYASVGPGSIKRDTSGDNDHEASVATAPLLTDSEAALSEVGDSETLHDSSPEDSACSWSVNAAAAGPTGVAKPPRDGCRTLQTQDLLANAELDAAAALEYAPSDDEAEAEAGLSSGSDFDDAVAAAESRAARRRHEVRGQRLRNACLAVPLLLLHPHSAVPALEALLDARFIRHPLEALRTPRVLRCSPDRIREVAAITVAMGVPVWTLWPAVRLPYSVTERILPRLMWRKVAEYAPACQRPTIELLEHLGTLCMVPLSHEATRNDLSLIHI